MTAREAMASQSARQRIARRLDVLPRAAKFRLGSRGRTWRTRLTEARNVLAFLLLAAVFAWRSGVSWRLWQQRHRRR